jgi:ACS family hexuronate transporter-like MFS transporter
VGGWLGARLIRSGLPLDRARKISLGTAAALLPAALLIASSSTAWAVAFTSLAFLGHQFWSANVQTLAADLFPSRVVGSVEGLLGSAGALGAGLAQWRLGDYIATHGYGLPFAVAGLMHLCAFALILLVVRKIEVLTLESGSNVNTS